jgi:2-polyprenyl-3-methyl-5-hydroxy-6-metoxy-1,4-benzoquinol methylase
MRILVAIANYGTRNDRFLAQVLAEYRSMPHKVDIWVTSNVSKDLGSDVRVRVGLPTKDPWTLPFAHKQILADGVRDYDLFIYSEDDILITQRNIAAFLAATEVLKGDEIAGFIRAETAGDGKLYFCDAFQNYHWDPDSVVSRGPYTCASFSNEHAACYVLTQAQLKRAIDSGGFLVSPYQGKYDFACSAATDPYTQCGMRKLVCVSHIDDFLVSHLSNKYIGDVSLEESDFRVQIAALMQIRGNERPRTQLMKTETRVRQERWSKSYYEGCQPEVGAFIGGSTGSVLSIGCGSGTMEACLAKRGMRVVGVPLDSVISACTEAKSVKTILGNLDEVSRKLEGQSFDYLLLSNLLHLVEDPATFLKLFTGVLNKNSKVIAVVPNLSRLSITWRRAKAKDGLEGLGSYERSHVHLTSRRMIRNWFKKAGMNIESITDILPVRFRKQTHLPLRLVSPLLAHEFITVARPD